MLTFANHHKIELIPMEDTIEVLVNHYFSERWKKDELMIFHNIEKDGIKNHAPAHYN